MHFEIGAGVDCDLDVLVNTRLLIQANSGGGKSWCIRRILEQTAGHVQHFVIDPEGEFASLRERFDYVLAAKQEGDTVADPRFAKLLAHRLLELNASAILNIYELKAHERTRFVRVFLEALIDAPKKLWHPALVVVDEAHVYCPQVGQAESAGAVIDLATRGRKRGFCAVLATQRLSKLHKDAAAECNNKLIGRTGLDVDMKRAADELGLVSREETHQLRYLAPGEFFTFGPALPAGVVPVSVGPVLTTHPKAGQRIAFTPPPPTDAIRGLLPQLADMPAEAEERAQTEQQLRKDLAEARRQLTVAQRQAPVAAPLPPKPCEKCREQAKKTRTIALMARQVERSEQGLQSSLNGYMGSVSRFVLEVTGEEGQGPSEPASPPSRQFTETTPAPTRPSLPVVATNGNGEGIEGLRAGVVRILRELAARHPLHWTKAQVATLTGFAVNGGTFSTYMSELKRRGLIDVSGNDVRVTEYGLLCAGEVPTSPTSHTEAMAMWKAKLRAGNYKMLEAIAEAGPNGIDRESLAEATDFTVTGGTFSTYLGILRRNGLVEVEGSMVRAMDVLFP